MRLAYVILCFKNFGQARRLIDRLNDELSNFVLVVDAKSPDEEVERFMQDMAGYPNVHFSPRQSVTWGTVSIPLAFLVGIRQCLKSDCKFDYVFTTTGQDYPLMKTDQIRARLAAGGGKSFLLYEAFPVRRWGPMGKGRLDSWNFFYKRNVIQFPKWVPARRAWVRWIYVVLNAITPRRGRFPLKMHPYGGSAHVNLTRAAAEYVDQFVEAHPEYTKRFRFTLHSDEVFYPTILANSPLKDHLIDDHLRFQIWPGADAASPIVLTQENLPEIMASNAVLARKFDVTVDEKVLDSIDSFVDQYTTAGVVRL